MPYNPTVNDRSGEILAGYQTNAAEIKAAGQQALADGIIRGATSAIGGGLGAATGFNTAGMITDAKGNSVPGLGEALDSVKTNAIKYDTAVGMMDTYKQFGSQMGIKAEDIDALGAKHAKNPDALIASLAVVGRVADNNMSMQRQQSQYTQAIQLAREKALHGGGGGGGSNPFYSVELGDGIDINQ